MFCGKVVAEGRAPVEKLWGQQCHRIALIQMRTRGTELHYNERRRKWKRHLGNPSRPNQ